MLFRSLIVVLLTLLGSFLSRPAAAQHSETQRTPTETAGTIPYASSGFARQGAPALLRLVPSPDLRAVPRNGRSMHAAPPPSWHLPLAGAALGAIGGVVYIAVRNKGETIAHPVAVLLPVPIGALLGYVAGLAVDEGLYGGSDR